MIPKKPGTYRVEHLISLHGSYIEEDSHSKRKDRPCAGSGEGTPILQEISMHADMNPVLFLR